MFHCKERKIEHKETTSKRIAGYIVMPRPRFEDTVQGGVLKLPESGRQIFFNSFQSAKQYTDERTYSRFIIAEFLLYEDKITNHCGDIFEYNFEVDFDESFEGFWEMN